MFNDDDYGVIPKKAGKPEPRQVLREAPGDIEIDVWFISLPDCPEHGYYENDVRQVANMLESAEDAYLVERKQMKAGQFYNLTDFEGF